MEQVTTRPRRRRTERHGFDAAARFSRLLAALLLLALAAPAQAVTLGQVRVISYLNQPLEAEIDLIGLEPGQHEDLRIRIANQDQFERLGITYTLFLSDLKFDIVQSSGRWIVRVRSRKPVDEPFLDFPVQMTWPGGRMIRQYTLLLDPLTLPRPATVSRTSARTSPPAAPAATTRQTAPAPAIGGATYGPVQPGETLWPIAQRLKPSGITTKQMAMALLRANPQAFIDGNINKLRAGAMLTVPPLGVIEELDANAASRAFAEQTRQWRAAVSTSPREVTATSTASTSPPSQADTATARETETPSEPPAETTASDEEADAQLRIVTDQTQEPVKDDAGIQQQLLVTMEEIESNRITTTAIESRLAKLEEELSKMQALVNLKDQQIEALQAEIDARDEIEGAADAAGATLPDAIPQPKVATPPTPVETPAAESVETPPAEPAVETPITVDATAVPAQASPRANWYDQYLWLIWASLGVIGLVAVGLMIRRQMANQAESQVPMADLPSTPPPSYADTRKPAREEIKQAERDFEGMASEPAPKIDPEPPQAAPLPEVDEAQADQQMAGLTNSLLDEMLDGSKALDQRPSPAAPEVDEQDIAQWVEELGAEIDELDAVTGQQNTRDTRTSAPEQLDDDIPSILNELDDQLVSSDTAVDLQPVNVDLAPLDEPEQLDALDKLDAPTPTPPSGSSVEDDTFAMSLDLARAYLEIGDNDGARDMLKQALTGARDPDHRRQIEELLQQID